MSSSTAPDKRRRRINIAAGFVIGLAGIGLLNNSIADSAMRSALADKCYVPRTMSEGWSSEELEEAGRFCQLGFNDLLTSSPLYLIALIAVVAVALGHAQISRKLGIETIGDLFSRRSAELKSSNPQLHQQISQVSRWGSTAVKVQLAVAIGIMAIAVVVALAVAQPITLIFTVPAAFVLIRYFRARRSSK